MTTGGPESTEDTYRRAVQAASDADREVAQYLEVGIEQPDENLPPTAAHVAAAARWRAAQEALQRAKDALEAEAGP